MTDLISRSAVHIVINSRVFDTEYPSEFNELERSIDEIPAIDAVPVVHDIRKLTSFLRVKDVNKWQSRIILDEGEESKNCAVFYREMDSDLVPVVRCEACVLHGHCTVEDMFILSGFADGYCRAGKRLSNAVSGARMDGEENVVD